MVNETKQCGTIIVGRCKCDSMVQYPFYWCEELISEAKKFNFKVIDLQEENFIERNITKFINEHNPEFIFLNGHGDEYSARGFNKSHVITLNKNDHLLKGRFVHIISCKTAKYLLQSSMDKGCKGYLGYKDKFTYWHLEDDPKKDVIAKMFQEAVNVASISLLKGEGIKTAFHKSQEVYEKRINECKEKYFHSHTSNELRDNLQDIISTLIWNKKHQVYQDIED